MITKKNSALGGAKADIVVARELILEIKAVAAILPGVANHSPWSQ